MVKKSIVMVLTKDILKPHLDNRVYKEAKTLVKHGYQVTVLCRVYSLDNLKNEEEFHGFKIVRHLCSLPDKELKSRFTRLFYNLKNVLSMSNRIIQLQPSIIHAHDLNALLESVIAKRKLKIPLVYDSHEDWPKLEQSKGNTFLYLSALIYENFLLSNVDYVITVNKILAEKFIKRKPCEIIHNFPEAKRYKPDLTLAEKVRKKYDLDEKTVIEYHGVLGREKGIGILLEAAKRLIKKHKNLKFLIIGPGHETLSEDIKGQEMEDHIIFTGPIDYDEIPSYISVADVGYLVILPTTQYLVSTPTKLFEAMLLGKPVVANREFPEVVRIVTGDEDQCAGILVNYDNNEIESALERLIADKELREKYGKIGHEKIIKGYTWEIQEDILKRFYDNIQS